MSWFFTWRREDPTKYMDQAVLGEYQIIRNTMLIFGYTGITIHILQIEQLHRRIPHIINA